MARHEEAVADLTRAVELDPGYAWAFGRRGGVPADGPVRGGGRRPDPGHRAGPGGRLGLPQRGRCLPGVDRGQEAVADLSRAVELDPGFAWALAERGETYRLMGRPEEAVPDLSRAVGLDPGTRGRWPNAVRRTGQWAGTRRRSPT